LNYSKNKKVAVIGGGFAGLIVAYRLAKKGLKVKIFESTGKLGGLAKTIEIGGKPIEMAYHHYFPSDEYFIDLCNELGVNDNLLFLDASMGYLINGMIFNFGTPKSLLSFKPLSTFGKFKFGLSLLKIMKLRSFEEVDKYTAEEWLIKNVGESVYKTVWKPLLTQKFSEKHRDISMAWLASKIQVRSNSIKNMFNNNKLYYLNGSLDVIVDKIEQELILLNVEIALNQKVKELSCVNNSKYIVNTGILSEKYDVIFSTISPKILDKLISFPNDFNNTLKRLNQLGVICAMVIMNHKLCDYYWLNIGDNSFPFGLLVEHTNFCDPRDYSGKHIIYLSKYIDVTEKEYSKFTDREIEKHFLSYLNKINNAFSMDWVEDVHVFRNAFAQPLIFKNYLKENLTYFTTYPNFYWLSLNHVFPQDRGINYAIKCAENAVEHFIIYNRETMNRWQK
tara:strand:+ start:2027 stop:3373 length:1347 start_codon:yes stop_codon:yes gene_type:complete